MKTSSQKLVNPLLTLLVFMVLCPGLNQAFAQNSARATQVKAQLHIPWKLLSARLSAAVDLHQSDGSANTTPIAARSISVPYDGDALNWNLSSGSVVSDLKVGTSDVAPFGASVSISKARVRVTLDSLSIDQAIEKTIGGVIVRVHLSANCGPIVMDQSAALVDAAFALNWANGSPVAALSKLDLRWAPGSWTFNAFTCTGPSGTDSLVQAGLSSFLKEPSSLKPFVEQYVSTHLQAGVDSVLAKLRTPFLLGTGSSVITVGVGSLAPAATGVVADLSLRTNSQDAPLAALPLPTSSVLAALSKTQPALVGDKSVIEFIVASRLASQPKVVRVDLQTVDAFHKLMHSRIEQLFAWQDLWHYPADAPFYLNLLNPRSISLARSGTSGLASTLPLSITIQSYRDKTWRDYVTSSGTAAATVSVAVRAGTMAYATTINTLKIKSRYSDAYRKKYNKTADPISDSVVSKAVAGPQAALSGTMKWPDIDLAEAGHYRASSFVWASGNTFSLNFAAVP